MWRLLHFLESSYIFIRFNHICELSKGPLSCLLFLLAAKTLSGDSLPELLAHRKTELQQRQATYRSDTSNDTTRPWRRLCVYSSWYQVCP